MPSICQAGSLFPKSYFAPATHREFVCFVKFSLLMRTNGWFSMDNYNTFVIIIFIKLWYELDLLRVFLQIFGL